MQRNSSKAWALYVRANRKRLCLSKRKAAEMCSFDPSLWTLIERDGHVPSESKCVRIGILFRDVSGCLVHAGIVPPAYRKQILDLVRSN